MTLCKQRKTPVKSKLLPCLRNHTLPLLYAEQEEEGESLWEQAIQSQEPENEDEIGQLLMYLCTAHVRHFSLSKRGSALPSPILGLSLERNEGECYAML